MTYLLYMKRSFTRSPRRTPLFSAPRQPPAEKNRPRHREKRKKFPVRKTGVWREDQKSGEKVEEGAYFLCNITTKTRKCA